MCRIGLAIARRLARDGARVMVSSRRDDHVKHTVDTLKGEGLSVEGTVCHVGKEEHRKQLIQDVSQQEVVGVNRILIIALFSGELMDQLV